MQRIIRGQKRILLTVATGTGKTFTAVQIVWKLIKSGWLGRRKDGQPVRVLFLADSVILRDQAYNTFSPFATTASDPAPLVVETQISQPPPRDLLRRAPDAMEQGQKGQALLREVPSRFL